MQYAANPCRLALLRQPTVLAARRPAPQCARGRSQTCRAVLSSSDSSSSVPQGADALPAVAQLQQWVLDAGKCYPAEALLLPHLNTRTDHFHNLYAHPANILSHSAGGFMHPDLVVVEQAPCGGGRGIICTRDVSAEDITGMPMLLVPEDLLLTAEVAR